MPGDPWLGCEGWQPLKQLTGQRKAGHTEGLRFFKHEVVERVVFFSQTACKPIVHYPKHCVRFPVEFLSNHVHPSQERSCERNTPWDHFI